MNTTLNELITNLENLTKGARFASLTYRAKGTGELARFNVTLGFSYHNAVVKSREELIALMGGLEGIEKLAAEELLASFDKTLAAHEKGEQNEDFTKKDTYIPVGTAKGLKLNKNDCSLQLYALVNTKVVLEQGEYKSVKSAPLTVAKNNLRKKLTVSKVREFALDRNVVEAVRLNGETLEFA